MTLVGEAVKVIVCSESRGFWRGLFLGFFYLKVGEKEENKQKPFLELITFIQLHHIAATAIGVKRWIDYRGVIGT